MVSDFNEFDEAARKIMATLAKKTQLYCVNVYDVLEDNAPKPGEYMAAEGNDRLVFETRTKAFRNAYHAYFAGKREALQAFCRRFSCRYIPVRTDEGPGLPAVFEPVRVFSGGILTYKGKSDMF